MSTITIDNPLDYQEGDIFTGTFTRGFGTPTIRTTTVTGPLVTGRASQRLHVEDASDLPYADVSSWQDVTVTRKVPDPLTLRQEVDALPVGAHFRFGRGIAAFLKVSDTQVTRKYDDEDRAKLFDLSEFVWNYVDKRFTVEVSS